MGWGSSQGGGGGGGEANTASNVGAAGIGVYDSKAGVDLKFRKILAASTKVSVSLDAQQVKVDVDEAQLSTVEKTTNKNAASGYAGLDAGTKVAAGQIPDLSGTYQVITAKDAASGYAALSADSRVVKPAQTLARAPQASDPAAVAGVLVSDVVSRANFALRKFRNDHGLMWDGLPFAHYFSVRPNTSTAAPNSVGTGGITTSGTISHPRATTSLQDSLYRTRFVSAAGAGSASGYQVSEKWLFRGNAAGRGGFLAWMRFDPVSLNLNGSRAFYGLLTSSGHNMATTEPSTLLDAIGLGWDTTDTNVSGPVYLMHNDNGGSCTKVATTLLRGDGAGAPIATSAPLDLYIGCKPNDTVMHVSLIAYDGTKILDNVEVNSNLPRNTVFLGWYGYIGNGAVASAVTTDFHSMEGVADFSLAG